MKKLKSILLLSFTVLLFSCGKQTSENNRQEQASSKPDIVGEEVSYATDSTEMKGYIVYDKNMEGKRPGIIVVHEWWGHNQYTRKRADMLAELGYTALAIDMYGDGKQAEHPDDAGKFMNQVISNMDEAKARFMKAMVTLKNHPTVSEDNIAAIGYCFGGSVVLTMANAGYDLSAVAAFHSGVQLPIPPSADIKAKILVCNGAADPFISPESVVQFKAALDSVGADYTYIAYDSAVHAFTSPEADALGEKFDLPLAYNEKADNASWAELQNLLSAVFE
jgi:dienelactone hydrolase